MNPRPATLPGLHRPNDRQADVIYLDADRDQVVLGTAGSGKTLMAVYRAVYLSDPAFPHAGRTLLVTFNKALVSYLTHLAGITPQLDVRTYHHFARGYLKSQGLMGGYNIIAQGNARESYLAMAIAEVQAQRNPSPFFERPLDFFLDELDWISGHGYTERSAYLEAHRVGRLRPLTPPARKAVWKIRESYLAHRASGGQRYDWWELPSAIIAAADVDQASRLYRYIVVDEAQDFPPEALRSLVRMVAPGGSVTLFADYAQQLYGQRTSYASCGLRIQRVEEFKENFRNNVGIAQLAIATAGLPHFTDSADVVVPNAPTVAGTPPTLFRAPNVQAQLDIARSRASELGRTGSVAVLARTWGEAQHAVRGIPGVKSLRGDPGQWAETSGVYAGTYYSAKGLEFDAVIMPFLDATAIPDSSQIEAFGEAEAMEREARLLYVGITRAREELLATYLDDLTPLLPGPTSGYWTIAGQS